MPTFDMYSDMWNNFSGLVREAVSGGQFVKAMSQGAISSTTLPGDHIELMLANASGDAKMCVGVAINNAASGERVTVATKGLIRTMALGTLVAGQAVEAGGDANVPGSVKPMTSRGIVGSEVSIGTALDDAVSGEQAFVLLNVGGL